MAVDVVGLADHLDDALGERGGVCRLGEADLQDGELVAAHARDRVGLAHQGRAGARHLLQQLVAGGVAQRIVDVLEVVEVEQVAGHDLARPHARESQLQPLVQQHAVGQVGQRVVERHVGDAALPGDAAR